MKKIALTLTGSLLLIFLNSCVGPYGDDFRQSTVKTNIDSCFNYPKNVFLFFEPEPIKFSYTSKCFVEVISNEFPQHDEMINRLKYQAYSNCANAIVNIKVSYVNREAGDYNDPKSKHTYLAKVYSGLAVKINSDSLYKSNRFGNWQEDDYKKRVAEYQKQECNQLKMKFFIGTATVIFCIAYLISKA
jgi:hypothetical protein